MICVVCHQGMTQRDYAAYPPGPIGFWTEARLRFVARHQAHNPKWARGCKNEASRAIGIQEKYGAHANAEELRALFVKVFGEAPNPRVKIP